MHSPLVPFVTSNNLAYSDYKISKIVALYLQVNKVYTCSLPDFYSLNADPASGVLAIAVGGGLTFGESSFAFFFDTIWVLSEKAIRAESRLLLSRTLCAAEMPYSAEGCARAR